MRMRTWRLSRSVSRWATARCLLGLSGGVDSAVAAALLYRAIGNRLTCVYVDHGFMRAGESDQVVDVFTRVFPVELVHVDASERFFRDLKGVTDPEAKRKIIAATLWRFSARRRKSWASATTSPRAPSTPT